jgi:hypothetical protein
MNQDGVVAVQPSVPDFAASVVSFPNFFTGSQVTARFDVRINERIACPYVIHTMVMMALCPLQTRKSPLELEPEYQLVRPECGVPYNDRETESDQ